MKKRNLLSLVMGAFMMLSIVGCSAPSAEAFRNAASNLNESVTLSQTTQQVEETTVTASEEEYNLLMNNLERFPVNFVYNNVYYSGFGRQFTVVANNRYDFKAKIMHTVVFSLDNTLDITLETAYYRGYDAYDYTVYFTNTSTSENTGVLKYVNAIDMKVAGTNPVLKGILGDHANQYAPYEYDLTKRDVNFTSLKGRATHIYFPYFNLENDNGGALFAIGWGGTWQADFTYDENTQETRFQGTGTVGLNTYLKPGEVVRTPLIAKVCYYERDEDMAMNKWRKWMVDCNMPQENEESGTVVQPCTSVGLSGDTGRPNSDGSISEGYDSWKRSLDAFYDHGLTAEYRWFDAGWYFTPYRRTEKSDWWGTVGTWDLDTVKWPDGSFKESVDYAAARGTKTLMWFEPERVTHLNGMVSNYGYKREWVLSDHGNNNTFVNNLGIPECLDWTLARIVNTMEEYGIHLYREDFNLDPGIFWTIGDGYEGENRDGITENLYMQGHYALWDGIIDYCARNGKQTYIDSCASGGGRNDLETLRRSVPFLRSDSDRTTCELRLAMTTRLVRWIPFTGASAKESVNQLSNGLMDTYVLRATMLPMASYGAGWYHDQDKIDWEVLRQGQAEWHEFKKYFYEDFYVLTPQRSTTETKEWTVYEYFDSDADSGVIQAFRPINAAEKTYKIQVKGINANRYYTLRDVDDVNSKARVKGSALQKGLPLILNETRSSLILYIEPCQD